MKYTDAIQILDDHLKESLNPIVYREAGFGFLSHLGPTNDGAMLAGAHLIIELQRSVQDVGPLLGRTFNREIMKFVLASTLVAKKTGGNVPYDEERLSECLSGTLSDVCRELGRDTRGLLAAMDISDLRANQEQELSGRPIERT